MKSILMSLFIIPILITNSCIKSTDNNSATLVLLQHNWAIVSVKGELLQYQGKPGDYYNFETNGFFYLNMGGYMDTSVYSLSSDQRTLAFYRTQNGIRWGDAIYYNITALTDSTLILQQTPPCISVVCALDSLRR